MRYYICVQNSLGDVVIHVETDSRELAGTIAEALSLKYHRESWLIVDGEGCVIDLYSFGEVVRQSSG